MKNSKLVPLVILKRRQISIAQIAQLTIDFYKKLHHFNSNYGLLNIISEIKTVYDSINIHDKNAQYKLANEILNQNIERIIEIDGIRNPDIDFLFNKSFISYALQVKVERETLATFDFCFSISPHLGSSIGSIVVNELCFNEFNKAKFFLDTAKASFAVDYSVMKIFDRNINKASRSFKAPLGLITYFSNDYEIPIPDDLEGIEYEYTDKGKYLILTRENIAKDEAKLEKAKQKLLKTMQEIADRVPEYIK
ncbi:MAG: hypothetical protein WBA74_20640 [Cyclobacteriaceae bacterium]